MQQPNADFHHSGRIIVENHFIRTRNVLLSRADCGPLFESLHQHREKYQIEPGPELNELFQQLLAAFALHCASRPRNELLAWTIRYSNPLVSFFFGGDTEVGSVTGRYFEDHVKQEETGEMHQEMHRPNKPPHFSMVRFSGSDAASAVHQFYQQSEQRPGIFIPMGGHEFALATAHPDYDEGWFTHIDEQTIRGLPETETLNLLETRPYHWLCGCSQSKIEEMLLPMMKQDPEGIFGNEGSAQVNCPRCNANYRVSREDLEKRLDTQ